MYAISTIMATSWLVALLGASLPSVQVYAIDENDPKAKECLRFHGKVISVSPKDKDYAEMRSDGCHLGSDRAKNYCNIDPNPADHGLPGQGIDGTARVKVTCAGGDPNVEDNPNDTSSFEDGQGDGTTGGTEESSTSCNLGGFGWAVCLFLQFAADLSDVSYGAIEDFLVVKPSVVSFDDSGTGTYSAWKMFRDIANAGLVVIFIIAIISQITGFGGNGK